MKFADVEILSREEAELLFPEATTKLDGTYFPDYDSQLLFSKFAVDADDSLYVFLLAPVDFRGYSNTISGLPYDFMCYKWDSEHKFWVEQEDW